ncbi:hypothetical protein HYS50_03120 [Candidatus Woesearchaeota archaeon]|nr:hypothetical protein [Candidatus Woesearchaeota archaeon]
MKVVIIILALISLLVLTACAPEKPLIPKDTEIKKPLENKTIAKTVMESYEEKDMLYVYDLIKKQSFWMNRTADFGKSCRIAAECEGWCQPVEGSKEGRCSKFPKPIGCRKRLERAEIFDVCTNLTIKG